MPETRLAILDMTRHGRLATPEDLDRLTRCVEICRTYRTEGVVVANIRQLLEQAFEPSPDIRLFGMALLLHVAKPDDVDLLECAEWIYWNLLKRKTAPAD